MLDINRLHNNLKKSYFLPRSGRTTRMLVEAIQTTISKQTIVIVAHNMKYARKLMYQICRLAEEMNYSVMSPSIGSMTPQRS